MATIKGVGPKQSRPVYAGDYEAKIDNNPRRTFISIYSSYLNNLDELRRATTNDSNHEKLDLLEREIKDALRRELDASLEYDGLERQMNNSLKLVAPERRELLRGAIFGNEKTVEPVKHVPQQDRRVDFAGNKNYGPTGIPMDNAESVGPPIRRTGNVRDFRNNESDAALAKNQQDMSSKKPYFETYNIAKLDVDRPKKGRGMFVQPIDSVPIEVYDKITNAGLSTKNQRLVIDGAERIEQDNKDPYYLMVFEHANDQKTDVKQCGSFLVNDKIKRPMGDVAHINYTRYSPEQYDKIMKAANRDGNKWIVNADLQVNPNGPGHRVVSNSVTKPTIAFDEDKHNNMLHKAYLVEMQKENRREEARDRSSENDNGLDL